jgi:hypothetical protein
MTSQLFIRVFMNISNVELSDSLRIGMQQNVDTTGKPRTLEGLRAVVFDFWMLGEFDKLLITGNVRV